MTSKVLWATSGTFNNHGTANGRPETFYENLNCRKGGSGQQDTKESVQQTNKKSYIQTPNYNGNHITDDSIVYDVPKSNECIYAQPQTKDFFVVDNNLVPSAAKLVLSHKQSSNTRSDILDNDFEEEDDALDISGEEEDFEEEFQEQDIPKVPRDSNNYHTTDYDNSDYGLEVIHEETESQMSSSDSEFEENELFVNELFVHENNKAFPSTLAKPPNKGHIRLNKSQKSRDFNSGNRATEMTIMHPTQILADSNNSSESNEESLEEIVAKHIRISPNWDPEPILTRLYTLQDSKPSNNNANKPSVKESISGFLNILSGNRKKGTFWNAWKRKYYVLSSGKLTGYEKENCQDLFQSINLVGGKVDFLDPTDFVGTDQSKIMTNRIIGIDDAKGHYYVLQCSSATEAAKWISAIQSDTLPTASSQFAIPLFSKLPSMFKDIILVDFGSTNIRAGVLTHQPTLPALFFAAVMSENDKGKVFYGNDVYLRENRKNAKIKFPIESTSKMCQNNLNIDVVKGFLLKIFKDLRVQPEKYRIIINLPRRVDDTCKKNILGLLFNTFQFNSALLCHQSIVSFWAYSADNGIICDVGERCDIVPVSGGFVLSQAWGRAPFGGQPLKHALRQGLGPQENGLYLSTPAENLVLRFIAENFIYTNAHNSRKMSQEAQEIVVEMDLRDVLSIPNLIGVNQNVLRGVAEGYFDPGLYGLDCDSLPKILYKSLQDCGMELRREMSQNIFVTGGSTMLPGFVERLELELTKLCPPHLKPKIIASPYRYHASFIGASVLSTTEAFEKSLIHRSKYDGGPGPAHWLV